MTPIRGIFYRQDGRLRAIWRLVGFFLVAAGALALLAPILGIVMSATIGQSTLVILLLSSVSTVIALTAAHFVMVRSVEELPWSAVWLGKGSFAPSALGTGAVLGAGAIAVPAAALLAIGWLDGVSSPGTTADVLRYGLVMLAVLIPAAAWEELLFRGYAMRVLMDAIGTWPAVLVTGVAFGAMHSLNLPEVQPLALVMVSLAGIFLGWLVVVRRSLPAGIAAHVAWNAVLVAVLHTEVSGAQLGAPPAYRIVDDGPDWATGGPWGAEGGLAAGLGLTVALLITLRRRVRQGER